MPGLCQAGWPCDCCIVLTSQATRARAEMVQPVEDERARQPPTQTLVTSAAKDWDLQPAPGEKWRLSPGLPGSRPGSAGSAGRCRVWGAWPTQNWQRSAAGYGITALLRGHLAVAAASRLDECLSAGGLQECGCTAPRLSTGRVYRAYQEFQYESELWLKGGYEALLQHGYIRRLELPGVSSQRGRLGTHRPAICKDSEELLSQERADLRVQPVCVKLAGTQHRQLGSLAPQPAAALPSQQSSRVAHLGSCSCNRKARQL